MNELIPMRVDSTVSSHNEVARVEMRGEMRGVAGSPLVMLPGVRADEDIRFRVATQGDFGWIDAMQKAESDKLGFLMESAIRKRLGKGQVVVAEVRGAGGGEDMVAEAPTSAGYCMFSDRYMTQGNVGIIYQLNIKPEWRRSLVGAGLVREVFDRSAYGTRLYGLWCRQDLAANEFWESLGFTPIAFRTGARNERKKGAEPAVHIYWQRHIRAKDRAALYAGENVEQGWWYPYETQGGLLAESRVVLPIPPEVNWRDVEPVLLPGSPERAEAVARVESEGEARVEDAKASAKAKRAQAKEATRRAQEAWDNRLIHGIPAKLIPNVVSRPMGFGLSPEQKGLVEAKRMEEEAAAERERVKEEKKAAKKAVKAERRKSDPMLVEKSREFRDRWLERVMREPGLLLEGPGSGVGKYEVVRQLEGDAEPQAVGEAAGRALLAA